MNQVLLVGKIDRIDYDECVIYLRVKEVRNYGVDIIPVSCPREIIDGLNDDSNVIGIKGKVKMTDGLITIVLEKLTLISNTTQQYN